MQALRAMQIALTPDKKRQKVEDDSLVSDDEQEDHELMEEDENEVPQPRWAKMERMLITIQGMMQEIQDEMNGVRNDVEEIKSELANVCLQAGFAQSSAQEALEAANSVEERVSMLEDTYVTKKSVEQMIDDAFQSLKKHTQTSFAALKVSASALSTSSKPDADKFSRTAVVGGFENDTPKDEVIQFLQTQLCKDDQSIEETYAYNFGSVGFIRFLSRDAMFKFLKNAGSKPTPTRNGKCLWISTSKTPEERAKAKHLGKLKRALVATDVVPADKVRVDYKRGIVFVNNIRVAELNTTDGVDKLKIDPVKMKDANILVEPQKIYDAVAELMQQ